MRAQDDADELQQTLNEVYGRARHEPEDLPGLEVMVEREADMFGPDCLQWYDVPTVGVGPDGLVSGKARVLLVGLGPKRGRAWVAFVMLPQGWTQAVRPLTVETATMPWLDAFVRKESGE